ncbi:hypothetical protein ES705_21723 [subsurface metagenome]
MKKMIKFSGIMAVLIWVTAFTASAQPGYGKGHHGRHGHWVSDSCRVQLMVDDLSKELSLTDEQKQKIEEIHYAHINEVKELREKYQNDCVGARDARIQLRQKMDDEVKKILNKEQQAKYEEFMSERRGPHGKHYGHWK